MGILPSAPANCCCLPLTEAKPWEKMLLENECTMIQFYVQERRKLQHHAPRPGWGALSSTYAVWERLGEVIRQED